MALTAECPKCKCPGQHIDMFCGFCGAYIDAPADTLDPVTGKVTEVSEVYGYRAWRVEYGRTGERIPVLQSPMYDHVWQPGRWEWAECQKHRAAGSDHRNDHPNPDYWVPVQHCSGHKHGCGFYAGRTWEHLIGLGYGHYSTNSPVVTGKVQMQGKIIPATNGWRAQQCRVAEIYVPHELWQLCTDLRPLYEPHGVKVELAATIVPQASVEWCPKCQARMEATSIRCGFCGYTIT